MLQIIVCLVMFCLIFLLQFVGARIGGGAEADSVVAELLVEGIGHLHQFAPAFVLGLGEEVELHALLLADVVEDYACLLVEESLSVELL